VVLVLEFLNKLNETKPIKERLAGAFDLLTQLPDDFMENRVNDLPQEREEWW
jgi:virulence-associated protein VagC